VSAIVVALLYGSWLARAAAALDLALLVVVGNIFGGLSHLDVAAVGHVTAMTVAAVGGSLLVWQLRRRQRRPLRQDRAGTPAG
jgi:membrane associated rhomboid family serine protease